MNEHFRDKTLRLPSLPSTTQAADGMPRRCWSLAEIEAMVTAGIISEKERFELIGGEVVPMSPKGARHEWIKAQLNAYLQRLLLDRLLIIPETTLRLDARTFVEPDFCVFPVDVDLLDFNGGRVRLAIEVADSSLGYDLGRKIEVYAAHGVAEVWGINAATLTTRIHRRPGDAGYSEVFEVGHTTTMSCADGSGLSVKLCDLGLTPASE